MLRPGVYDYRDTYIVGKGGITVKDTDNQNRRIGNLQE